MKIIYLLLTFPLVLLAYKAPPMPSGELGKMVRLGADIANNTHTHPLTKDLVGNSLDCKSCHVQAQGTNLAGTQLSLGTWIGTATAFPAYSKREKTIQTLEDRSNNCFMRSMNGQRLQNGTKASIALSTYITWLSSGMPMKMDAQRPVSPSQSDLYAKGQKKFAAIIKKSTHANYKNGQKVYNNECAACHSSNGEGMMPAFPPLWGFDAKGKSLSFNVGAGMADPKKSAVWIQDNMPKFNEHSLSDQDAADVSLYLDAQPRENFDLASRIKGVQVYNSAIFEEKHTIRSRFKSYGLDIDVIRADKKIK